VGVHPVDATLAHARVFSRWSSESLHLAPSTVARCLALLSGIYRDAQISNPGLIASNPFDNVRRPRVQREVSTPSLSLGEAREFLTASEQVSPRSHALGLLLLTTGIRISEALAADLGDLTRHADGVTALEIIRKGEVRGRVALPSVTLTALEANLRSRSSRITTLVRAARGISSCGWPLLQGRNGRLTASEARREIERICRAAGWENNRVTAHGLRHSFATAAVEHGEVSPRRVQHVLGHASLGTTEGYLHDHRLGDDVTLRVADLLAANAER
jgi:integrase/recombinase XerD